jgi:hypothetical protein
MQTLEVAQRPMLQVKNDRLRMTAGNIVQQVFVRGRQVHGEVGAQPASQRLSNRWIFLQYHNIQSHKSPDRERGRRLGINARLRCGVAGKPQLHRQLK